jgi:hypothetical protein
MIDALGINPLTVRGVIVMMAGLVLVFWTVERLLGQGGDPSIRASRSTETGTMSFLVSGVKAVMLVAGVVAIATLGPVPGAEPLVQNQGLVLGALGLVVVAHWYYETEEREA